MKIILPVLVLSAAAAVVVSPLLLGSDPVPPVPLDPRAAGADAPQVDQDAAKVVGHYTGAFGKNKITIRIEKVVGTSVLGYSIVAGNERAFSGSSTRREDGIMIVVAREPGDDKNDGVFQFRVEPDASAILGWWQPYDKKLETKHYRLARRVFRYDPTVGDYPQSSTKLLAKADLEESSQHGLRVMRSEIYARHGYSFKKRDIREYFDDKDWYMPMSMDVAAQLTPIEKKNEALIKRFETYAAEYYDKFGR